MRPPHSPRHEELLPAYALGALDAGEERELLEHLGEPAKAVPPAAGAGLAAGAGTDADGADDANDANDAEGAGRGAPWPACPVCAAQLRQLMEVMEGLALNVPPAPLAEDETAAALTESRRRLLAATAETAAILPAAPWREPQAPPSRATAPAAPTRSAGPMAPMTPMTPITPMTPTAPLPPLVPLAARRRPAARWAPWLAAAAMLVLLVGGAVSQARLRQEIEQLRGERTRMAARADALARRVAEVEAESELLARTMAVISSPGAQSVQLAAMGSSHASGRTWVDTADHRAAFYARNLPQLGPDKTYQLWFIDDEDRKTSAGIFAVNARGEGVLTVGQPLPAGVQIEGWVVTIEPRGGRPQPTGPIALAG